MKKLLKYPLLLALAALVMAGCHHDNPQPVAPNWHVESPSQEGAPRWEVPDEVHDITSRMYLTAAFGDTVTAADRLAAFCGGMCIGSVAPVESPAGFRFQMVINRPQNAEVDRITLAFYSASARRVGYWVNLFAFEQDAILGSIDEPLQPSAASRRAYPMSIDVACSLPASIQAAEGDKLAVFGSSGCRVLLDPCVHTGRDGYDYCFELPLSEREETVEFRYWQAATGTTFTASGITVRLADAVLTLNPIPFK